MEGQQNHGAASTNHHPSDPQHDLPVHSESSVEQHSPSSHGQANSHPPSFQESDPLESTGQLTSNSLAQTDQQAHGEDDHIQHQNHSNTYTNANPSIRDEARVAVVIYDMLIRVGPQAEVLSAQLAHAYPVAAAFARHYANYAANAHPSFVQQPAHSSQRRGNIIVLRRVNISSVAWFCSFIASMLALLRLWMIFSLAMGATIASSSEIDLAYQIMDHVVSLAIEKGPKRQLYQWMFTMLNEGNPLVALDADGPTAAGIQAMMPNQAVSALLITPITSGITGFVMGVLAALFVNSALRAAGGIHLESRED